MLIETDPEVYKGKKVKVSLSPRIRSNLVYNSLDVPYACKISVYI